MINLEFTNNYVALGPLRSNANIQKYAKRAEKLDRKIKDKNIARQIAGSVRRGKIPVPGPKGFQGKLWQVHLTPRLRICKGLDLGKNGTEDGNRKKSGKKYADQLYILVPQDINTAS